MFGSKDRLLRELRVVTFFVTYRCNARCRTCFYWRELNNREKEELSLDEIERVAKSLPRFPHLLLSGGEPLLREDLPDLIRIFARREGLSTIDIPTNGLLVEKMVSVAGAVLEEFAALRLTVGVSLDGLEATHDAIRGVAGNFKKAMELLDALQELREGIERKRGAAPLEDHVSPKLQVYTLSVITEENAEELESLAEAISKHRAVDGMMFEVMRGEPADSSLKRPRIEQFERIVEISLKVNDSLFSRRYPEERATRLSYLQSVYGLQREWLREGKMSLECRAGRRLAVIEPNGDVRLCELLPSVGNLRDYGYDFGAVWSGAAAWRQRHEIASTRCACTHCVNLGHSIDDSAEGHRARLEIERELAKSEPSRLGTTLSKDC
jgi:MoaA/NifB/PqqE/SkfB family radical SAM enzyme